MLTLARAGGYGFAAIYSNVANTRSSTNRTTP